MSDVSVDLLRKLTIFSRIVEAGSISAAARSLRLSAPIVSRALAALEEELETSLLLRTTRSALLTEAGRELYERSLRILREVEDARAAVRGVRTARGRLTVSTPVTLGLSRISPIVPALLAQHPELRIDLRLEEDAIDLVGEGVDVAIRVGLVPPDSAALIATPLYVTPRLLVAAPSYLQQHGEPRTPDELRAHAALVVLPLQGAPRPWVFLDGGREVHVAVDGPFRSTTPLALRDAAVQGLGITLLPLWLVQEPLARGDLCPVMSDYPARGLEVYALYRTELRSDPRVQAFMTHLRGTLQTAPE